MLKDENFNRDLIAGYSLFKQYDSLDDWAEDIYIPTESLIKSIPIRLYAIKWVHDFFATHKRYPTIKETDKKVLKAYKTPYYLFRAAGVRNTEDGILLPYTGMYADFFEDGTYFFNVDNERDFDKVQFLQEKFDGFLSIEIIEV